MQPDPYISTMELIFIYNAGSGMFEQVSDYAHKIFSPSTYACSLCSITHGHFGPKKEWKNFIDQLTVPVRFYHKDAWEKENPALSYPAIIAKTKDHHRLIVSSTDLENISTISQLKALIMGQL